MLEGALLQLLFLSLIMNVILAIISLIIITVSYKKEKKNRIGKKENVQ